MKIIDFRMLNKNEFEIELEYMGIRFELDENLDKTEVLVGILQSLSFLNFSHSISDYRIPIDEELIEKIAEELERFYPDGTNAKTFLRNYFNLTIIPGINTMLIKKYKGDKEEYNEED